jgi:hypothetical protein
MWKPLAEGLKGRETAIVGLWRGFAGTWNSAATLPVMQIAQLVLGFLDVVLWPLVVGGALLGFRHQIASKIGDLKEASTPLGQASFWERETREVEALAGRASVEEIEADLPPAPYPPLASSDRAGPVAGRAWLLRAIADLDQDPKRRFDTEREVAATDPKTGLLLAYRQLESVARASLEVAEMGPNAESVNKSLVSIVEELNFGSDFLESARSVKGLVDHVTHSHAVVTTTGALRLIDACEHLAAALASRAMSRMRHPSRAQVFRECLDSI